MGQRRGSSGVGAEWPMGGEDDEEVEGKAQGGELDDDDTMTAAAKKHFSVYIFEGCNLRVGMERRRLDRR